MLPAVSGKVWGRTIALPAVCGIAIGIAGITGLAEGQVLQSPAIPLVVTTTPHTATVRPVSASPAPASVRVRDTVVRVLDDLDASKIPQPAATQHRLVEALEAVEAYVKIDSDNGQAWARFLRLSDIRDQMAAARPDPARLAELEMNMRQNYPGLENAAMLELRQALNAYKRSAKYGANPDAFLRFLEGKLQALLVTLDEPAEGAGSELAGEIGLVASFLHDSELAPWAVDELREVYGLPNVQFVAKESLINRVVTRSVAEPSPVDECILGTRVLGRACLRGALRADVLPNPNGVSLDLSLSGDLFSNNRGYNRGVVLRTTGTSPVYATKHLVVSSTGSITSLPAQVSTNLQTQIHAIEHPLRIVRKIARNKAAQQKPQADAIARGRLQRKLQRQYDQQVGEQVAEANAKLQDARRNPPPELQRLEIPQPQLAVFSTDQTVGGNLVQAASFQLASATPCPLQRPASSDVVVELHQSVAINTLETLLADRTIRSQDLDDIALQTLGEVPDDVREQMQQDPWEITFAAFNPIQMEFDDDRVKLTVRFARMEGGENSLPRGAQVAVSYRPSFQEGRLVLERVGELEIEVRGIRSSIQATSLRSAVKAKLDPIFASEIKTEELDLRRVFPNAPAMHFDSLAADDGWLQIGAK